MISGQDFPFNPWIFVQTQKLAVGILVTQPVSPD